MTARTVIKWSLNELMARHRIKGKDLAVALDVRPATVTSLRQSTKMPRLDSDRLESILVALNSLADKETVTRRIELSDLIEWVEDAA